MEESEKAIWRRLVPRILPSELLKLKRNLLQQLFVDAQFETVDEIVKRKKIPKGETGLVEMVLGKVLARVDQIEERTRLVAGDCTSFIFIAGLFHCSFPLG